MKRFTERLAMLLTDENGSPSDFTETIVIGSVILAAAIWLVSRVGVL